MQSVKMRLTGSSGAYARPTPAPKMPPGLIELLEGLTKDVLKNNPDDVYEFCAGHVQKLLEIRDGTVPKKQLKLDEKIKRAQEKIRQRIKDRQLQYQKEMAGLSDETLEEKKSVTESKNQGVEINPVENIASSKQPVHHGDELVKISEVEIFHEPDVIITTTDNKDDLLKNREVKECLAVGTDSVQDNKFITAGDEEVKESSVDTKVDTPIIPKTLLNADLIDEVKKDNKFITAGDEEVKESSVATKVDTPIIPETLQNADLIDEVKKDKKIITAGDEEVKESSDATKVDTPIIPETVRSADLKDEVKKDKKNITAGDEEVKESSVATKVDTPNIPETLQSADFKDEVKKDNKFITAGDEEVKDSSVTTKVDTPIIPETLQSADFKDEVKKDSKFITAGDEEVKESSVAIKVDTPIIPKTLHIVDLIDEVKKEAERSEFVIEKDIAAPLEAVQSESSTNDVKDELNKNIVKTSLAPSDIVKNEESQREVHIKQNEKVNDENTEIVSEIKQVIVEPENISGANPESLSQETQNIDFPTKLGVYSKPSDTMLDNKTEESRDEEKTIVVDVQEVIKNEHEEKEITQHQEKKENLDHENVPLDIKDVTEIGKVIEDKIAESEQNRDASKLIENKAVVVEGGYNSNNKKNDNKTVTNESKSEVENNSNNSSETTLESLATAENQSSDKHPEPPAKTIIPAQLLPENETVPTATHIENQEHSNDHVDQNVHQNDINNKSQGIDDAKKVTDEKHVAIELFENENDIIHNNASDQKTDVIAESDEPIENAEGSGMDLETAAITIQKVFRTFLFSKSRASTLDDTANDNSLDEENEKKDEPEYIISSANLNKERRTLGISRMDTVLQTVNEEKSLSLSTDDSSTLSSAATTIQAHVRGFLVRNRLASYKTASNSSLVNSEGPSTKSLDGDTNEPKKTILNIHIVPERGQFMSRDESMLTSIDLPLDNSPPSSINLHPLGYDKSEPRKQLKREDAIQSISPPSNNSGKLSEEVDSVKDSLELKQEDHSTNSLTNNDKPPDVDTESCDTTLTISSIADTVVDAETFYAREVLSSPEHNLETNVKNEESATNFSSDEMDVVTPFPNAIEKPAQEIEGDEKPKLVHTGEFHDVVLQTQVKRSESSVVREFKNVLVYFLLWDKT